jgi:uncharacterized protein YyaL (SSP411 family)
METQSEREPNRLIHEPSPYLRQHARNPVDWYPWGPEALDRARREDKPIFLSIGYSACHWCHVMERESFEDEEIARSMNERFVNIKVDREERPDLDRIYMSAVQAISGSGGWPMSVFLTPELKPFYGGTYFPPEDRYGRPGFPRLIEAVATAYRDQREKIEQSASEITAHIESLSRIPASGTILSPGILDGAAGKLFESFDPTYGGFGGAPKFPHSLSIQVLLRHARRKGDLAALQIARTTLDHMAAGGIYDHLGGGFHRYSTDERWLVPHFEKMLYDNALLAVAYLEAYQVTAEPSYQQVVRETLDFLLRDMTDAGGGFYSTLDADSEGEEGRFYTWTQAEVERLLGPEVAPLFARAYDVDAVGNFEGRVILHRIKGDAELASIFGAPAEAIARRLAAARSTLHEARGGRIGPHRDEKVLTDWNALAISAFARSGRVLDEARYTAAAARAADFLLRGVRTPDGGLAHMWKDGAARVPGFLEDHAGLLVALCDLYEATGETRWLAAARDRSAEMHRSFWDEEEAGFFDTAASHEGLITRTRRVDEGATPSGNSLAAYGLLRLGRLTGDSAAQDRAERTLRAFARFMDLIPSGTGQLLLALDLYLSDPREVAVVGSPDDPATRDLRRVVDRLFLPHVVLLQGDGASPSDLEGLRGKVPVDGRPAAYVCSRFSCREPVTTAGELEDALKQ